jgi:hypothetical protein
VNDDRVVPPAHRVPAVCNHCGDADAFNAGGDFASGTVSVHHFSGKICSWSVKPGDLIVSIGDHEIRVPPEGTPVNEATTEIQMDHRGKTKVTSVKRVIPGEN